MQKFTTTVASLALAAAITLAGCASGGAASSANYNRNGYHGYEKDGRVYVFVPGSGAEQKFKRGEEMVKSVTRISALDGKTVVADPDVNLDRYLGTK
ncbi:MAG: hypothetical protein K8S99_05530 [Planctomycetes bacterium]|nr:hypothetical protein [Planctomycetota bacterium]